MQLFMRRPSLAGLPAMPALTSLFTLRAMTPDDLKGVAKLLAHAFDDASWTSERARKEFCDHPDVVRTWLILHGKKIITTATTLLEPKTHPGSGCVHWVATDPDYRGQSLGYISSLRVLHDFVELGCRDAILRTDDARLAAIKTYLKLGFVPEPLDETQPARWEAVLAKLQHPRAD